MIYKKKIKLFWWNEVILQNKPKENYGDMIGPYLVEKISGKKVVFTHTNKKKWKQTLSSSPIYLTVGSILAFSNQHSIIWGSGIINKDQPVVAKEILAVRGPRTRQCLLDQGYEVPEVYGDPALLLPDYYLPKVEKKYEIGIIPHYNDYKSIVATLPLMPGVKLINLMTNDVEATTREILECKHIISSSLHGIIVAQAYGIPAVWQRFSDKLFGDNIKFRDYFESVNIKPYIPHIKTNAFDLKFFNNLIEKTPEKIIEKKHLNSTKEKLMSVCPFID